MTIQSLPEEVLDRARQYRGAGDEHAWEVADFVASVVAECTRSRGDRTRALKQLAQHMGVSRASASDLCQLAETYEAGVRERYSQLLTIGHFREAMRSKTHGADELLERCIRTSDEWSGMPMPVDMLRQTVRSLNAEFEPAKTKRELYVACVERAYKSLGEALDYCDKPAEKKSLTSMREWLQGVTA